MTQTLDTARSTDYEMEKLITAILKRNTHQAEQIARTLDLSALSISQRIFIAKSGVLKETMLLDSDIAVRYAASRAN
ncbi:hypothetical protein [Moritella yayanosii]|uniref:Uncharacterized protein n=1 Tax=Moritella yayanosii TaxID=69539 RepID=A0A330LTM9_9GAMM|nr:hypothetical protein [Moritella yayanosii]SQD80304.1 conserved protein of unknown function [Moritella yayanosii]